MERMRTELLFTGCESHHVINENSVIIAIFAKLQKFKRSIFQVNLRQNK